MADRAGLLAALSEPAPVAAPQLLGCRISGGGVTVRLTEVEAYAGVGQDPGSHAHRRRTRRNASMFGRAGHAYMYFTYGMHWCLNVVCGPVGEASAVLLRAGEVMSGNDVARVRRPGAHDRDLARGPARLATVLGADGSWDGSPLLDGAGPLWLVPAPAGATRVQTGPRVGVADDRHWRFWMSDEPTVSAFRRHARGRTGSRNRLRPTSSGTEE